MHKRNRQPQPQLLPTEPSVKLYPREKDMGKRAWFALQETSYDRRVPHQAEFPVVAHNQPVGSMNTRLDLQLSSSLLSVNGPIP